MRMRKKPNLGVRIERCTRVLISDPEERKGKWRELMPEAKEVFLELGCGKGRFTAETAAQNPQALYIAVERVPDAMVIAMERVCAQELHNVFFVDGALIKVPMVIIVKSRLHNVFFMLHLPCIKYIKKQEDFLSPCFVKICIISKTLSVKFHVF